MIAGEAVSLGLADFTASELQIREHCSALPCKTARGWRLTRSLDPREDERCHLQKILKACALRCCHRRWDKDR